jgi:uncharacterized protein
MQRSGLHADRSFGPRLPKPFAHFKHWLTEHHMTLIAIADTPHSIALGSAIGIFFGFTPLYSLKTLLSIAIAWILRCNKIAAVIAVTIFDVAIFAMPAIHLAEYQLGCWCLGRTASPVAGFGHLGFDDYLSWQVFSRVVWPAFVGSLFLGLPSAIGVYFVIRILVSRGRVTERPA